MEEERNVLNDKELEQVSGGVGYPDPDIKFEAECPVQVTTKECAEISFLK